MAGYALAVSDEEVGRYLLMAERAVQDEAHLWQLVGIVPGAVVADVGCGPAATSVQLARAVAPGGRVIGVERDESALAAARAVVAAAGVDVELRQGEATDTGLESGSVDVAVLRHVLAHNGGAEAAIVRHLAEIARPGGCVYLVDVDLTAVRELDVDPDLSDQGERYVEFQRRRGNDVSVGLRLRHLLEQAGLEPLVHEGRYTIVRPPPGMRPPSWAARDAMVAEGVITADDVDRWAAAYERTDAMTVRPTLFAPTFIAVGRKV
ncbi:MAG: methyltransferase domain-containing protein [Actinomycetes bacterium]